MVLLRFMNYEAFRCFIFHVVFLFLLARSDNPPAPIVDMIHNTNAFRKLFSKFEDTQIIALIIPIITFWIGIYLFGSFLIKIFVMAPDVYATVGTINGIVIFI